MNNSKHYRQTEYSMLSITHDKRRVNMVVLYGARRRFFAVILAVFFVLLSDVRAFSTLSVGRAWGVHNVLCSVRNRSPISLYRISVPPKTTVSSPSSTRVWQYKTFDDFLSAMELPVLVDFYAEWYVKLNLNCFRITFSSSHLLLNS